MSKYFKRTYVYVVCLLLPAIVACGSGGSGGPTDPSSTVSYISWSGSANGVWVLDANNNRFRFRSDNGVMNEGNTDVTNVKVVGSDVYVNGSKYGVVSSGTSTQGATVAVLKCSNGSMMSISNQTISCSGTTGGTTGGSTTGGNTGNSNNCSGFSSCVSPISSNCVTSFKDPNYYNWISFKNNCGQAIYLTYYLVDHMSSGGSAMNLASGQSGNTGYSSSFVPNGFSLAICPAGYSPWIPATRSYWDGTSAFTCVK